MAKTNKPTVRIHDLATGEVIDREMNAEELAAYQAEQAEAEAKATEFQAEAEAKAQAKAELLAKLGITDEEAKLLLS